jgi:predicted metalloprotease
VIGTSIFTSRLFEQGRTAQEAKVAEETNTSGGGGGTGMAFIVGALVVVVAVIAYFVFTGGMTQKKRVDINVSAPQVEAPKVPDAPKPAS